MRQGCNKDEKTEFQYKETLLRCIHHKNSLNEHETSLTLLNPRCPLTSFFLTPKSIGHIFDSLGSSVRSFMIIPGLHNQLWSGNNFQSPMLIQYLDFRPFDPKDHFGDLGDV